MTQPTPATPEKTAALARSKEAIAKLTPTERAEAYKLTRALLSLPPNKARALITKETARRKPILEAERRNSPR